MKQGTNFQDRNKIRKMAAAGKSASAISKILLIDVKIVRGCIKAMKPADGDK